MSDAAGPGTRQTLRIPLTRLNRLSNTVSELLINQERLLEYDKQLRQASRNLKKRGQQLSPIREQVESLYDELSFSDQTQGATNGGNGQTDNNPSSLGIDGLVDFDALEMDSYSAVHSILQRFQELMVQVQEIQEDVDLVERDLQETLIQMNQSLHQLDDELTQSRLVPFNTLARTFIQPLEKLGDRHKKPVKFVIEGDTTLIEVAILDQLRTPLTHLIRNAFDHGLEFAPDRQGQGKPPTGTITLRAAIAHNQVVVTVADDGRGVDLAKIQKKAMELGLTTPEKLAQIDETQILDFLFQPGFSTASKVSDLSGRGLGLDIVKQMIEGLRGNLQLETELGQGSQFIIRIPLTLSITPLLLVRCQQRLMAFPSESILRILSLDEYPLRDGQLTWKSQSMPVRPLMDILPYGQSQPPLPGLPNKVGLMIQLGNQPAVLTVEKIVDERPLVVKALDAITPIPSYVAGCTVLGTGEVVPVLIPNNFSVLWRSLATPSVTTGERKAPAQGQITILAIDDSITVRRTLQRVLGQTGFQIIQCRDGQEAWDLLNRQAQGIDLALCDIEMPNMDGFSLLQLIRAHQDWRHLPVVMLTSRENPLHRNRAMALGASGYLTKPFQPNQLIASIQEFLTEPTPVA
jgi:type IV pili sensor histidine kinase/response regulator